MTMHDSLNQRTKALLARRKKRRRLTAVLVAAAVLVFAGVFWQLRQSVIAMTPEPICGLPEHTHSQNCMQRTLICGMEEGETHIHTDDCYTELLSCGLSEHRHTDACYPTEAEPTTEPTAEPAIEPIAEPTIEPASNSAANLRVMADRRFCFAGENVRFDIALDGAIRSFHASVEQGGATIAETDDVCESLNAAALDMGGASAMTLTVTAVMENGETLTEQCTVLCAVHGAETASEWRSSARISESGVWSDDTLAVAQTQLGYRESADDFIIDAQGNRHGYTRYGDWSGDAYRSNWSTAFAAFCLKYADVPTSAFPRADEVRTWIDQLKEKILFIARSDVPAAGDLIFLDRNGDGTADAVGIVRKIGDTIAVIEGDCDGAVAETRYAQDDSRIVGYGSVSAAQARAIGSESAHESDAFAEKCGWISVDEANLRAGAGTDKESVTRLERGAKLTITAIAEAADGLWYQVRTENGEAGYVRSDLVSVDDSAVTVAFAIDTPVYTNDGGASHLTSARVYENAQVEFTPNGDAYTITGQGVLLERALPAGSTAAQTGLNAPEIGVVNPDGCAERYASARWQDENGTFFDAQAALTQNVVYHLVLTSESPIKVDFVCGADGHSVLDALADRGYQAISVYPGESLAQDRIPTAEDVYAGYDAPECRGRAHGEVLDGWFMDAACTEPLKADTILSDYAQDSVVRIYAAWRTLTENDYAAVTLYGAETRRVVKGYRLGELPGDAVWLNGETGETVNAETIVTGDMTLIREGDTLMRTIYVRVDGTGSVFTAANGSVLSSARNEAGNVFAAFTPEKKGYAFVGWTDESGASVTDETTVAADMVIEAQFAPYETIRFIAMAPDDSEADAFEKVYTRVQGAPLSTAVDENGAELGEAMPEAPEYSGYRFAGWILNAIATYANEADAQPNSEIAYIASYVADGQIALTLHDVMPDGENDYDASPSQLVVDAGKTLRESLSGVTLHDGRSAVELNWYMLDVNGARTAVDPDVPLNADAAIYTYTYALSLRITDENPRDNESVERSMTLTYREGDIVPATAFVQSNVDFTAYTWTAADGTTLDLKELMNAPMTEKWNVSATGVSEVKTSFQSIYYYVIIDGKRQLIGDAPISTQVFLIYTDPDRNIKSWYISAAMLEQVYGQFGFKAEQLTEGTTYFPHTEVNKQEKIWADRKALDGFSPILASSKAVDAVVCYVPRQMKAASAAWSDITAEATFHTITVLDEAGNEMDGLSPQYGLNGADTVVRLENGSWKYWPTGGSEGQATEISVTGGSCTIPGKDMNKPYTAKRNNNRSYVISIADKYNKVYATAEELAEVNAPYTGFPADNPATNVQVTVRMPNSSEFYWEVIRGDGTALVDNEVEASISQDGSSMTFTFARVERSYVIQLRAKGNAYGVVYKTNMLSLESAGSSYGPSSQAWINGQGPSTVQNEETPYTDLFALSADQSYVVKAPDTLQYQTRADYITHPEKKLKGDVIFTYSFWGWEGVNADGERFTLQPGDVLTEEDLNRYAVDGVVTVTARYGLYSRDTDVRTSSLAFYVIINSKMADVGGGSTETPAGNYSDTVYSTHIYGDVNDISLPGSGGQLIYASEGAMTAVDVDTTIRTLARKGYTYGGKTVYLDSVPSDEECLARLRTWASRAAADYDTTITLDGVSIKPEDLTTDNFTIRWFVFKYQRSDGWHIDGLLVPKQGKLIVTKTFDGDPETVSDVKENFSIEVKREGDTEAAYNLNLEELSVSNQGGYTSYDPATDTYTWVIDINQTHRYTLREMNAQPPNREEIHYSAQYAIERSNDATNGFLAYEPGTPVTITGYAYATDMETTSYQTVRFRNSYIPLEQLCLRKVDALTGHALAGVGFRVFKDGKPLEKLYRINGIYYQDLPASAGDDYEVIADGILTTDESGCVYLMKDPTNAGMYTLQELPPEGYKTIEPIQLMLDEEGNVEIVSPDGAAVLDEFGTTITVRNYAERLITLTVKKEWAEGDTPIPVKVRLMYNGNMVYAGETGQEKTLSAENNWTYTWYDQPLYVNGEPAQYTVREMWIGDNAYDAQTDEDGYLEYVVEVDPLIYTYSETDPTDTGTTAVKPGTDRQYAKSGLITVHNAYDRGRIAFEKVDADKTPLAGARFRLYATEGTEAMLGETVSDADGLVVFENVRMNTVYYIREVESPDGYKDNALLYKARVTPRGTQMEYLLNGNWEPLENNRVINEKVGTGEIELLKTNENGSALQGATFKLQKKQNNLYVDVASQTLTTSKNGYIAFLEILPGEYRIKEVFAPQGYYMMPEAIDFTVDDDGVVTIAESANRQWHVDDDGKLVVVNYAGSELPMTGGTGPLPFTIGGLILMIGSLLYIHMQTQKRRARKENGHC